MCMVTVIFFFSSRRRHTRYWRDWSSDVCSSDLIYENTGGSLGVDVGFKLTPALTLYGRARYSHAEYAAKEALAPEKRKDDESDLAGGLNWMATEQCGFDASYVWTDNNSTFGLYQYRRDVTTISTFVVF